MGKTKHTRGPWRIEFANYARTGVWVTDGDEAVAILKHPDLPDYDATDNAALISAAPDLLETLEQLVLSKYKEALGRPITLGELFNDPFASKSNAIKAIKKAKGVDNE